MARQDSSALSNAKKHLHAGEFRKLLFRSAGGLAIGVAMAHACAGVQAEVSQIPERAQAPVDGASKSPLSLFRFSAAEGLGEQAGVSRRDPSDVLKAGRSYYVWYTKVTDRPGVFMYPSGYSGAIWYATSHDGRHWIERSQALGQGRPGAFDDGGVFTPNILAAHGKYYLFYTAVRSPVSVTIPTAIGVAVADSPGGPWIKLGNNPVLLPSKDRNQFDSFRVDDACLVTREGKYWLYYKGRQQGHTPAETKWGVAIAERPAGPYLKSSANPVVPSGHEVLVWPQRRGIIALVGPTGPQKNTIQYAADGLHFTVIAHIASPPAAPGAYRPDAFTNTSYARGIRWGISMKTGANPYLVRFDCDCNLLLPFLATNTGTREGSTAAIRQRMTASVIERNTGNHASNAR